MPYYGDSKNRGGPNSMAAKGDAVKLRLFLASCLVLVLALCGCGTTGTTGLTANTSTTGSHKVVLTWAASPSAVAGYNVYRASAQANSYVLLNATPITGLAYTDSSVQSGQTYYYAVAAIDAYGVQSVLSNQVTAVVPNP